MENEFRSKSQLIDEVEKMRQQISNLEQSEIKLRTSEKALRESEQKYRTLADNINIGVYRNTIGPQGKFIEANQAIIKMFGYKDKKGFFAMNVADLYQNPSDRKKFNEKMLRAGFGKNEELLLKKKDGAAFIGSVSAVAVKNEKGEVLYYDGIIEDITEKKKIEEENIRLNKELNKRNKQLKALNIKLLELSIKDGLTNIYNHRFFQETLLLNFRRAKRSSRILSCIMFDIDDFKKVNDNHGHRAGDFVLVELVSLVKQNIRRSDVFARYGGEEFVVLLPDNDLDSSAKLAEKIRILVESYNFVWKEKVINITISFGISSTELAEIESKEALLEMADRNLLIAKQEGKNRVYA